MFLYRYSLSAFISVLFSLNTFSQQPRTINSGRIIEEGTALYNKDKYKEAIAVYDKVPRSDTNYSIVLYDLSLSHYADSNFIESKSLAEEGLQYYPEKADDYTQAQ